jgi:hypothetical protein
VLAVRRGQPARDVQRELRRVRGHHERRRGRAATVADGHERADSEGQRLALVVHIGHPPNPNGSSAISTGPEGVSRSTAAGAVAGAFALTASYALARRAGITRFALSDRLAPGRPVLGRLAQLGAGTAACVPAAFVGGPVGGLAAGTASGAVAALTTTQPRDRVLAVATHCLAGLVAGCVSRAARAPR